MKRPTLILDNGASHLKVGMASLEGQPRSVPNGIFRGKAEKRNYIGDELEQVCQDYSALYYRLPFEKGLLVNWSIERAVWNRVFQGIEPKESQLVVTEPYFNLPKLQEGYDQVIFEEYEFEACWRSTTAELCVFNPIGELFGDRKGSIPDCVLIVDSGYSFTHIIPFFKNKPIKKGIRRLDVGGKLLTNYLKETVSFRYYDMMEETFIINDIKEQACFMSQDVYRDLDICKQAKNSIIQEYVLPDFVTSKKPQLRTDHVGGEQVLKMNNERFMTPEILMHPSDIGIDQAGIPEAIQQSVEACDPNMHGLLYANIVLVGGNAKIPGYMDRIEQDLRRLVPSTYDIRTVTPHDSVTFGWEGGNEFLCFGDKSDLEKVFVNRKDYLEFGHQAYKRK